jgi:hypothetical protein
VKISSRRIGVSVFPVVVMRTVKGMRLPDRARSVTESPAASMATRVGSARSSSDRVSSASSVG